MTIRLTWLENINQRDRDHPSRPSTLFTCHTIAKTITLALALVRAGDHPGWKVFSVPIWGYPSIPVHIHPVLPLYLLFSVLPAFFISTWNALYSFFLNGVILFVTVLVHELGHRCGQTRKRHCR
jgi:hypothetical protein